MARKRLACLLVSEDEDGWWLRHGRRRVAYYATEASNQDQEGEPGQASQGDANQEGQDDTGRNSAQADEQ